MPQAIELGQTGADNDRIVTGEFVQLAGQDMVADRMQRAQIVQRDAAHQPAARAAPVGGQQRLAIQHRQRADDAGDGADAVEQRLVVVDLLAGEGLDGDVAVDAEDARLSSSVWKPLMTLVTTISVATPSAMPTSENTAMIETKRSPLRARR